MSIVRIAFTVFALLAAVHTAGTEESIKKLQRDPFRPIRAEPQIAVPAASISSGSQEIVVKAPSVAPPAFPNWELRAVLLAGERSMVNVSGTLVVIGAELDGYRLTRVSERHAEFVKQDATFVLTMD